MLLAFGLWLNHHKHMRAQQVFYHEQTSLTPPALPTSSIATSPLTTIMGGASALAVSLALGLTASLSLSIEVQGNEPIVQIVEANTGLQAALQQPFPLHVSPNTSPRHTQHHRGALWLSLQNNA